MLNVGGVLADILDELQIGGQVLEAFEPSDDAEQDEALRVHVPSKIDILAQVVNRKVVFPGKC